MEFLSVIDRKRDEIIKLANTVWENPEIAFKEYKSSAAIISFPYRLCSRGEYDSSESEAVWQTL